MKISFCLTEVWPHNFHLQPKSAQRDVHIKSLISVLNYFYSSSFGNKNHKYRIIYELYDLEPFLLFSPKLNEPTRKCVLEAILEQKMPPCHTIGAKYSEFKKS